MTKTTIKAIFEFIFIEALLLIPVLLILLGFDFVFDLKLDFFSSEYSFSRIIFFIWFLIATFAYIKEKYGEEIKKII